MASSFARASVLGASILLLTSCAAAVDEVPAPPAPPAQSAVNEDFSTHEDGQYTTTVSGDPVVTWPAPTNGQAPRIVEGKLTLSPTTANGGGYASVTLPEPATSIGASVSFSPYTEAGGLVALVLWSEHIGASFDAGTGVPASPVHFTISPEEWAFGVVPDDGSEYKIVGGGKFASPLIADAETIYSVSIDFDADEGSADVTLPSGEVVHVQDDMMKQKVFIACVEPYRAMGTMGSTVPAVSAWWAN